MKLSALAVEANASDSTATAATSNPRALARCALIPLMEPPVDFGPRAERPAADLRARLLALARRGAARPGADACRAAIGAVSPSSSTTSMTARAATAGIGSDQQAVAGAVPTRTARRLPLRGPGM